MPNISETEVTEILADTSKQILGDLEWEIRPEYESWISFQVIHQAYGRRIYGLCLNIHHRNRDQSRVSSPHKHRWTETDDDYAYSPPDITALAHEPSTVWTQFCAEARINHLGQLQPPPPLQPPLRF
jgi:hypothetical protein